MSLAAWVLSLPFRFPRFFGLVALFLLAASVGAAIADAGGTGTGVRSHPQSNPSQLAKANIPDHYLTLYRQAGKRYGVPWTVLAGIGAVESNHGRSQLPGVRSGANAYGACGPMQIGCVAGSRAGNSWARYGHGSPYDPDNAIPAAARYLVGHGAHRSIRGAVYGYNHANWYVNKVLAWSERYRTGRTA